MQYSNMQERNWLRERKQRFASVLGYVLKYAKHTVLLYTAQPSCSSLLLAALSRIVGRSTRPMLPNTTPL